MKEDIKFVFTNDIATLKNVAAKLESMSKELAESGVTGYAMSLKAQAMTIKSIIDGMLV